MEDAEMLVLRPSSAPLGVVPVFRPPRHRAVTLALKFIERHHRSHRHRSDTISDQDSDGCRGQESGHFESPPLARSLDGDGGLP